MSKAILYQRRQLYTPDSGGSMSFQILNEDEDDTFKQYKDEDKTNSRKEVIVLGGKLLCSEVYSLMGRTTPDELQRIEIQTGMNTFTDVYKDEKRGFVGHKLKKSRSFTHEQKQKRKRDKIQKQPSFEKSKYHTSDSVLCKGEFNELSVLTESFDTLARTDYLKSRFPPIFQESKSLLKRKQGEHTIPTATKEFLPSLNIKGNFNEKFARQTQRSTNLPTLIHKQGLTAKALPPSPESRSIILSSENTGATFSEASPIIPRKKPPKSYEDDPPPSPRRATPFPSIWGEDRVFMLSIGNNVINEKAKTYIVKEEQE